MWFNIYIYFALQSYRGRKPSGGVSIAAASSTVAAPEPSPQPTSRPSPQPQLTMLKPDQPTVQQPMVRYIENRIGCNPILDCILLILFASERSSVGVPVGEKSTLKNH